LNVSAKAGLAVNEDESQGSKEKIGSQISDHQKSWVMRKAPRRGKSLALLVIAALT
jgi:hypothetical protein